MQLTRLRQLMSTRQWSANYVGGQHRNNMTAKCYSKTELKVACSVHFWKFIARFCLMRFVWCSCTLQQSDVHFKTHWNRRACVIDACDWYCRSSIHKGSIVHCSNSVLQRKDAQYVPQTLIIPTIINVVYVIPCTLLIGLKYTWLLVASLAFHCFVQSSVLSIVHVIANRKNSSDFCLTWKKLMIAVVDRVCQLLDHHHHLMYSVTAAAAAPEKRCEVHSTFANLRISSACC